MEGIIIFLEQYWGVTIVGGVTFGMIVTFTVVQLRTFLRDKFKDARINTILDKLEETTTILNTERHAKNQLEARVNYLDKVIATVFKALSYIIVASKLESKDKIELQEDFNKLVSNAPVYEPEVTGNITEVKETSPEVIDDIAKTVSNTASLLDKYAGEK